MSDTPSNTYTRIGAGLAYRIEAVIKGENNPGANGRKVFAGTPADWDMVIAALRSYTGEPTGEYVPDVDGERYRAIRDKGIAFSAWQDENGVQWAVNGRVGKDLDALVDEELLKRGISGGEVK